MFHVTPSLNLSTLRFRWVVASVAASSDVWAVVKSPIRQTRAKKLLECLPLRITSLHYRGKVPLMFAQPLLISFSLVWRQCVCLKKGGKFLLNNAPLLSHSTANFPTLLVFWKKCLFFITLFFYWLLGRTISVHKKVTEHSLMWSGLFHEIHTVILKDTFKQTWFFWNRNMPPTFQRALSCKGK